MLHLLIIGTVISVTYFAVVWAISVRIKNYGLLDVAWSYAVAILAPVYAFLHPGVLERQLVFTMIGVLWSVRLGTYILRRVISHHPEEDRRYETLRKQWPGAGMFLLFFELQAVVAVIFSLPFLFAAFNPNPTLSALEITGLTLAVFSLAGEMTADHQMKSFKSDPANRGKVCENGLWYFSRHPNYFFEASFWVSIALASLASPFGWITIACPLLMLHFLINVTGIAITEEYSIKSKGDAYRQYQRTTSAFIPWFRKKI